MALTSHMRLPVVRYRVNALSTFDSSSSLVFPGCRQPPVGATSPIRNSPVHPAGAGMPRYPWTAARPSRRSVRRARRTSPSTSSRRGVGRRRASARRVGVLVLVRPIGAFATWRIDDAGNVAARREDEVYLAARRWVMRKAASQGTMWSFSAPTA